MLPLAEMLAPVKGPLIPSPANPSDETFDGTLMGMGALPEGTIAECFGRFVAGLSPDVQRKKFVPWIPIWMPPHAV